MSEQKNEEKQYPVRSLHDFLFELDKEWTKFRNGTLIGLGASAVLFVIVLWLLSRFRFKHFGFAVFEFALLVIAAILLAYSVYAMYSQYRFLSKWERRIGLLLHMEEEMLSEKLEDPKSQRQT
ncbi:MAG TPA: hypothetical protein VK536_03030 [Candidatus Limnocylindrales bacterium]|nr:hypothetical protein [Candidatus Limnocylindrales bacterium]